MAWTSAITSIQMIPEARSSPIPETLIPSSPSCAPVIEQLSLTRLWPCLGPADPLVSAHE
jgi:hypothetical protein